MEFRKLAGENVSAIGMGCEYLDGKPYAQVEETINAAIKGGVNIFDVFMPGAEVRENIAKAMGGRRENIFIQGHIGSTNVNRQYDISRDMPTVQKFFEELLRTFGYIDYGMMFFIDGEHDYKNVFETEFINYVQRLKKNGDIRHIGFSSHNPITARKVIETGVPEMMLFSINPAFDMLPAGEYVFDHSDKGFGKELFRGINPEREALYQLCAAKQIGITVMKMFGGGKLLSPQHTPYAKPMTVPQCIHYALSRPSVASVLPGCKTADEMNEALRYFNLSDGEKDYTEVLNSVQNDFKGSCVYCGHCQPCPSEIDIAAVNKYLDIARLDLKNIPPSIKSHYKNLPHTAEECIQCGSCESRCPFNVPIIKNMEEAAGVFE